MVCAACGGEMVEGVHFCKVCGARVNGATAGSGSGFGQQPWMPLGSGAQAYGAGQAGASPYAGYPPVVAMPGQRVRQNLQALGIAWYVMGAYRLLKGLAAGFAIHTIGMHFAWFGDGSDMMPDFFRTIVPVIAFTTVVMSALSLLTGYGLTTRKSWGRPLAIVMAILSLIKIPLGTAIGIYTLWVLAPSASGLEYDAIAAAQSRAPGEI
jgi:hypothetical protein